VLLWGERQRIRARVDEFAAVDAVDVLTVVARLPSAVPRRTPVFDHADSTPGAGKCLPTVGEPVVQLFDE
jgi:hypothetical protein